jgi:tetratricopeptide (TPR) repeat protein
MSGPAGAGPMVPLPFAEVLRIASEYEQMGTAAALERAEGLLERALMVAPDQPDALCLKGVVAFRQGHQQRAIELMERAVARNGNHPLYFRNLCMMYERAGRFDEALRAGEHAVTLAPNDPVALHNLMVAQYRLLQVDKCISIGRKALTIAPASAAIHFTLAEALLLSGQMKEGWEEYEWRFQISSQAQAKMPAGVRPWNGNPIADGVLLLIGDQGFGDVIQFTRYVAWAVERCERVTLACDPEIEPLMGGLHPAVAVVDSWDPGVPYAAYCPLSSLPRLHGTTLDNIPASLSYLRADPAKMRRWGDRLDWLVPPGYRRIGIAWAGRQTHLNDINRSAALAAFAPIAAVEGIALVSLQKGDQQAEIRNYYGRAQLVNLGAEIEDFADTAAIITNLDLIVTVDTAVAHLAAAMGRSTWIMLPYAPDWRWLLNRTDSPWYPTVRLFRQSAAGDWERVTRTIALALADSSSDARGSRSSPQPVGV